MGTSISNPAIAHWRGKARLYRPFFAGTHAVQQTISLFDHLVGIILLIEIILVVVTLIIVPGAPKVIAAPTR